MNTRQDLIDTYTRYERELEQAEANVRRLRNRMMRLAVQMVGTEDAPTRRTQGRRIPVTFAQPTGMLNGIKITPENSRACAEFRA
jgi:hypothetical protein